MEGGKVIRVLVCDDLDENSTEFSDEIEKARQPDVDVVRLFGEDLTAEIASLIDGADGVLAGEDRPGDVGRTRFDDDVDLVVLDNNLAQLDIKGARLTAEAIAGYIRAFSAAPYVVSINKNPDVDFDLRYLVGDYASRADLALNLPHLSNGGLWTGRRSDAPRGFLPWYWPKLLGAAERRRRQIEFVSDALDRNVCESLGIPGEAFSSLSRQSRSLLSQAEEATDEPSVPDHGLGFGATFRQVFLASPRSLPNQSERRHLLKKFNQDEHGVRTIVARVVAAEIDFWFRRDVLAPQELLVDVPHLLMRMPFLLGERASDLRHWNSAVDACVGDPPFGMESEIFDRHLERQRFQHGLWVPTPAFWWAGLKDDDELNSRFSIGGVDWSDAVFCEDQSTFVPRQDSSGEDEPAEFVAQFEGPWSRRYVANLPRIRYVPKSRFAQ